MSTLRLGLLRPPKNQSLSCIYVANRNEWLLQKNIRYIEEAAVNPDRRRYAAPEEAPRHYIDLDVYGDSAAYKLPRYWKEAVEKFGEDSLTKHGIVPWHINRVYFQLKEAFL